MTITIQNWDAGMYIGYFLMNDVNFDYKAFVQARGLPDAISMVADQIVIDVLNVDTHMKECVYEAGQELVDLFADCEVSLDSAIDR